ncbi:2-succinyl-5-enolpyruvyl-6-hydroxy-3-cyclohexene-1-carboxylic-acid synthase [Agarivorans aestuarii]|uniref:2-succinyl-5-enolpyruvyl-6-hydroxy-3-cyclohexene-1-carboxylate synthase n=1 Tax=Agarivorans aestuarii TaxID=1563703 RepID=A0ABU7G6Q1_9ALTE|nr:2-succinyl-5-enolpyruvyl-6-hydroxy-3-cyclohexene-1-carboxylic-acid synthase [Agarivorans aestuarii]MEE1674689.1 2-succinyl-5-enolpyruvyl-6-hydroxy-3-cyclohexene-1-carboxylic-acid synthase [Agarivorans aestuarii]
MNKNINIAWAEYLIEDCIRHGIRHFCIAPGSRSTPLTLAVANHPKATSHCHFDERGLGFFALGLSKARQQTVAIITTSGSAVANLYPAVVEAKQSSIPLLVLGADRPQELISVGANQAIEQQAIFAHYPIYSGHLAEPSIDGCAASMLTQLGHALALQQQRPGPIHLNCPYREPFYPEQAKQELSALYKQLEAWINSSLPYYQQHPNTAQPKVSQQWPALAEQSKVLIVIGQQTAEQSQAIIAWAQQAGWPIVVDCQSHWQTAQKDAGLIQQAELLLANSRFAEQVQAELIIQFGGKLVSKRLNQWLASSQASYYLIDESAQRINPGQRMQQRWQCTTQAWLHAHPVITSSTKPQYLQRWTQAQQAICDDVNAALLDYSELAICAQISAQQNPQSALFMGNSMVVRLFELLGQPCKAEHYFANRGASGIDGLLATSVGIAAGLQQACTLVIGDTSLLHDLNSLSLAANSQQNLVIVLFNNNGGEIFNLLPALSTGQQDQRLSKDYYQLPHQADFAAAAATFNLAYQQVVNFEQFSHAFERAQQQAGASFIEVCFTPGDASARYQSLINQVASHDAL